MKTSETYYRSKLLKITSDMGYSSSLRHEIMLLFGNIKPEQKEEVAKAAIPLVMKCETDEEVINTVSKVIEQISQLEK